MSEDPERINTLGRILQFLSAPGAQGGLSALFRYTAVIRFTEFVFYFAVYRFIF